MIEKADPPLAAEPKLIARLDLLGAAHEGAPGRAVDALVQRDLDARLRAPAPDAAAFQPRRDHLAVVDHQAVAGRQQVRQVSDVRVLATLSARPRESGDQGAPLNALCKATLDPRFRRCERS